MQADQHSNAVVYVLQYAPMLIQQAHANAESGEEWGGEEGENTMVKVLVSQRDRFKDKANQLEHQLAQVHSTSKPNSSFPYFILHCMQSGSPQSSTKGA